jgi:fructokinase
MRIGVDLGGTKIEAVALDEGGGELARRRVETPGGGYEAVIAAVAELVGTLEARCGAASGVGIGTPGSRSPLTGLIRNSNSQALNGRPLERDLEKALGRPVALANDADCFALSEATDGAGAGARTVFGVILGTGVGAGIVVGGRLLHGPNAVAGEWGHNPLPWPRPEELPGPACYCGKSGCIETWLSGPGMAADHLREAGEQLTAEAIAAAASAGEPHAELTLRRYEERLARALAHVINILDPHVIVLGGGLSKLQRLYRSVPALWGKHVFSEVVATRLLPPRHGDASGVRGAAWL